MVQLRKQTLDGKVETLISAILELGPNYGYALVKDINGRADGLLNLGEGTIYPVLHRMEERGLIAGTWRQVEGGRQRKYYRLTPKGRKTLADNRLQWQGLCRVMENILGSPKGVSPIPQL